jgi:hypothetical protein
MPAMTPEMASKTTTMVRVLAAMPTLDSMDSPKSHAETTPRFRRESPLRRHSTTQPQTTRTHKKDETRSRRSLGFSLTRFRLKPENSNKVFCKKA